MLSQPLGFLEIFEISRASRGALPAFAFPGFPLNIRSRGGGEEEDGDTEINCSCPNDTTDVFEHFMIFRGKILDFSKFLVFLKWQPLFLDFFSIKSGW